MEKKAIIEQTPEGYQIATYLEEKTPGSYPIIQEYKLENFLQVLGALAEYFGEKKNAKHR